MFYEKKHKYANVEIFCWKNSTISTARAVMYINLLLVIKIIIITTTFIVNKKNIKKTKVYKHKKD